MESIELPEPHTKLYTIENEGDHTASLIIKKEHTVKPFFTVAETVQLMKLYADACVGKKLIDMGYKDHVTSDPEDDLAKTVCYLGLGRMKNEIN